MTSPSPAVLPSPALDPADVVLAQLAGLQREPHDDVDGYGEGLVAAWEFASPGNREATGPLARFAGMLRNEAYRGLLGHRAVQLGPVQEDRGQAQVEVLVVTADDRTEGYTWVLGRQTDAPYAGCWMTDGVVRHPDRG
ncbi:MAG: hypothetical protein JWN17_1672 [Frankiales bacterium]|nr:hypothetical protein [Frankiales bacterium]